MFVYVSSIYVRHKNPCLAYVYYITFFSFCKYIFIFLLSQIYLNFATITKEIVMEDTKHIKISEYDYPLPDERIAKFPLQIRDQSKLLVYNRGEIGETKFTSLPDYLEKGELMIFNNTKVIQARLHFHKQTGALIEIFCLEPASPSDYALSFQQRVKCSWLCMIGNLKKWKDGVLTRQVEIKGKTIELTAKRGDI